jgi:hypothetical protein
MRPQLLVSGGDRIRTCDLEVMSLASYLAAPPRVRILIIASGVAAGKVQCIAFLAAAALE